MSCFFIRDSRLLTLLQLEEMMMLRHEAECCFADVPHKQSFLRHLQETEICIVFPGSLQGTTRLDT